MSLRVTACQAYDDRRAAGRQPSEDTQLPFLSILCCPVSALLFFTRLEMRVLASVLCEQAGTNTVPAGSHRSHRAARQITSKPTAGGINHVRVLLSVMRTVRARLVSEQRELEPVGSFGSRGCQPLVSRTASRRASDSGLTPCRSPDVRLHGRISREFWDVAAFLDQAEVIAIWPHSEAIIPRRLRSQKI